VQGLLLIAIFLPNQVFTFQIIREAIDVSRKLFFATIFNDFISIFKGIFMWMWL